MFEKVQPRSKTAGAIQIAELIFHNAVRSVRSGHANAILAVVMNMAQAVIFTLAFYFMFQLLGMRGSPIRGDYLIFIMSGVFLYMTHIKTIGAVKSAGNALGPMMQHAPMNTAITILSAMLSTLYIQTLSLIAILFVYDVVVAPGALASIHDPIGAYGMLLLAWMSGAAIGLVFMALTPWAPTPMGIISTVYTRANMIASGKMFAANMLTPSMLAMFDWNPLFHAIDQARGFAFLNYWPRNSSITYPVWVIITLVMIGLMLEFYTRRRISVSWGARR
ncbi:ABC-type polysaccharide/polyol phosphate export permease [Roseivivax halotolerans]|jgi:ABC-type polysaccharide/polyol phosphate export permease|uniref:ABC-type polysaccharide/polyol phosphate export permease n=1 Tax=Roseivivax halotolerans TaxID=93684 RepID=A0A1I5YZB5_9RHOB|nr:ABC transporter permease [Roseivivax halotolerans]SFQ49604.1 ABC-type polysaccharide/polyol phosphate export permease [Roseivivax halotolerans]